MRHGIRKLMTHIFRKKVFYPPPKCFTPPFSGQKSEILIFWKNWYFWRGQKIGGKKLLRGVKNFFIKKYGSSAFQCRVACPRTAFSYFYISIQSLMSCKIWEYFSKKSIFSKSFKDLCIKSEKCFSKIQFFKRFRGGFQICT